MWSAASHGAQLPLHGVRVGGTSKHMGQRLQGHRPWAWGTGPGGGHRWHSRDSGLDAVLCDVQSSQSRSREKVAQGGLGHVAGKGLGPVPWAVASPSSAK